MLNAWGFMVRRKGIRIAEACWLLSSCLELTGPVPVITVHENNLQCTHSRLDAHKAPSQCTRHLQSHQKGKALATVTGRSPLPPPLRPPHSPLSPSRCTPPSLPAAAPPPCTYLHAPHPRDPPHVCHSLHCPCCSRGGPSGSAEHPRPSLLMKP